nr:MAG TPA: hypothetical protein [Caudoviricetes sp.]
MYKILFTLLIAIPFCPYGQTIHLMYHTHSFTYIISS